jgi:hypothetical protein
VALFAKIDYSKEWHKSHYEVYGGQSMEIKSKKIVEREKVNTRKTPVLSSSSKILQNQ